MGMVLYDCEIIRPIESNKGRRNEYFKYADNWTDYIGMGISCICAYDYFTGRYRVFMEDNLCDFVELIKGENVVGFNNHAFDDKLIAAHGINIESCHSYDILQMIWRANGLQSKYNRTTHGGYGLSDMVKKNNLGSGKTMDAISAPYLWQTGQKGRVVDYCLEDVRMLKSLVDLILANKPLVNPKTGMNFTVDSWFGREW